MIADKWPNLTRGGQKFTTTFRTYVMPENVLNMIGPFFDCKIPLKINISDVNGDVIATTKTTGLYPFLLVDYQPFHQSLFGYRNNAVVLLPALCVNTNAMWGFWPGANEYKLPVRLDLSRADMERMSDTITISYE